MNYSIRVGIVLFDGLTGREEQISICEATDLVESRTSISSGAQASAEDSGCLRRVKCP